MKLQCGISAKEALDSTRRRFGPALAEALEEINQTPAWWTREYNTLTDQCFTRKPFNAEEHDGHHIIEERTYSSAEPTRYCTQCPTQWQPTTGR